MKTNGIIGKSLIKESLCTTEYIHLQMYIFDRCFKETDIGKSLLDWPLEIEILTC
jgi:hypothetical protein